MGHFKKIFILFVLLLSLMTSCNKTASLSINANGEFQWPNSEIVNLLPNPESNKGVLDWESSREFSVRVYETSKTQFDNYVNECSSKGFIIDVTKGEQYYYAFNEKGYYLSLSYHSSGIMTISINESDKTTESITTSSELPFQEDDQVNINNEYIKETFVTENNHPDNNNVGNTELLTIENNEDMVTLFNIYIPKDQMIKDFVEKYKGRIIEFDGFIFMIINSSDVNPFSNRTFTRDVFIMIGNSEYEDIGETEDRESYGYGPPFTIRSLRTTNFPVEIDKEDQNVRIRAKIVGGDGYIDGGAGNAYILLEPISFEIR